MTHPMHLHGHDVQVTEIDGKKLNGAVRDTLVVPPKSTITVILDADNPGVWAFHCHILYHALVGMFTVMKYHGADTQFWQPEKKLSELDPSGTDLLEKQFSAKCSVWRVSKDTVSSFGRG